MTETEREISDLPLVSSILGTDRFPLSRDGSAKTGTALSVASYVVSLLTSGAPTALDTWLEIVERLEDDEDTLASLLAAVATKASLTGVETLTNKTLTSPTLNGTPTAPTAPRGTNTTQVATAEMVQDAVTKRAFKANKNSVDQTGIAASATKVTFTTEEFDDGAQYDAANSRFQPTRACRARVQASIWISGTLTDGQIYQLHIYKNGSPVATIAARASSASGFSISVSALVTFNGSSDYVEVFYQPSTSSGTVLGGPAFSWFEANEL